MADILKQIKVGNTIYNIEPYTSYLPLYDLGNATFKVTRGASQSTKNTGYWAGMLNSGQEGSPTLPSTGAWWHVISMDWTSNDSNNWISQLALPTQHGGVPHYRRNNATDTSIDSSTWHAFITDENIGSQTVNYAKFIKPHQYTTSTGVSEWTPSGTGKVIWGQKFVNSSISTDTGDLVLTLRPSIYSSGNTELCMHIDGDYYSNGNTVIHSGNIGSQSVNYATSSHLLRTYNADNGSHGTDYYLKCRHNVDGDHRFKLQIVRTDGSVTHSTSVDYANSANTANSVTLKDSSGTTTKATMQYNSTEDCIEFIFA